MNVIPGVSIKGVFGINIHIYEAPIKHAAPSRWASSNQLKTWVMEPRQPSLSKTPA